MKLTMATLLFSSHFILHGSLLQRGQTQASTQQLGTLLSTIQYEGSNPHAKESQTIQILDSAREIEQLKVNCVEQEEVY